MKPLYGVWNRGKWLKDIEGHDLVTDFVHASESAADGYVACYYRGHHFPSMMQRCTACNVSPYKSGPQRWCPHANPSATLEIAEMARRFWESLDAVAALCVEAGEGREPTVELLDRLYERDVKGFRSHAEALAKVALGR